jgi:hypothetical protein
MGTSFQIDIQGEKRDIDELQNLVREERISQLKIGREEGSAKIGDMGAGLPEILNVVLNASAVSLAVSGVFACVKTYLIHHPKDKVVMKKDGETLIEFNPDNVKDADKLISEFIQKLK